LVLALPKDGWVVKMKKARPVRPLKVPDKTKKYFGLAPSEGPIPDPPYRGRAPFVGGLPRDGRLTKNWLRRRTAARRAVHKKTDSQRRGNPLYHLWEATILKTGQDETAILTVAQ